MDLLDQEDMPAADCPESEDLRYVTSWNPRGAGYLSWMRRLEVSIFEPDLESPAVGVPLFLTTRSRTDRRHR